ncbi:MAG: penicillin-binding protein activator [Alphaproteobacteria bacterium]|nr:penicillin-binding protein activator [Alphaproteobacteria bacterium]
MRSQTSPIGSWLRRALPALALGLTLLAPGADAGILGGRNPPPDEPSIVVQARAVAQTDRLEAIGILEDYIAEGGDPELLPWVTLNAGEQRRLAADPAAATAHFRKVNEAWHDHPVQPAASLGLALLAWDSGKGSGNTLATLRMVDEAVVPPTMNADRYRILALEAERSGEGEVELRKLVGKALSYAEGDVGVKARAHRDLGHLMTEEQAAQAPDVAALAGDEQALARARSALAADDYKRAIETAQAMLEAFPDTDYADEADWVIRRAQAGDPYNARKIGVLLPLSGTYAPPGKQLKDAIQLAVEHGGGGVQLVFRDTAGDTETALKGFDELVLQEGCAAIIGPLLKDAAFPVAEQAQAANVPMVTLTQAPGVTEARPFVFRSYLTYEQQVDSLLDHVMDDMGLERFAVFAPDSSYGRNTRDEFTRQVLERGGQVVHTVMYDPGETDLRKKAAELGQKDYKARSGELYRLKREAEEKGMNPDKVVLPPVADFQAIFIPDNYQQVALVASALAYEEFAVGGFKPRRNDVAVPLLGLNGWNNPELVTRGGLPVQKSYFVDAFYVDDPTPTVGDFVGSYQTRFSRPPGVIDAVGYDTGRLLSVAARTSPADREAFREALAGAALSGSVSRAGSFTDSRELSRQLYVFSVDSDGIYRVKPPLEPPPGEPPP